MQKVIMGNHAASHGVRLARVQVISAYPITPQTQIVEELSEMCAKGALQANFLKVESEHSAMAAIIAAASTGVRTFTATSSQGLALMHELLHWASGARLPLVMVNVNRAMAPGWSIWSEQTDSLSQRDTGWCQLYVETNQEVLDSVLQAYRVAEQIKLPVMVCYDAFILSHTYEPVDLPELEQVDAYLPPYTPEIYLDPEDPHAFNGLVQPDSYMEMRFKIQAAMDGAAAVFNKADEEFEQQFGRRYHNVETVDVEDAETVLVTMASMSSPARLVVARLREQGIKIGLVKLRLFRPFPTAELRAALRGKKRAIVIDRNCSFGKGGIIADEIRGALANDADRPLIYGYIAGLGGRDLTLEVIEGIARQGLKDEPPPDGSQWMGVMS
ncbi:MAG: transketolase C-terminal domain-containing protein [Candidatus Alcyoniella australis]|nr:transketolase C-terminal domain-containing protein [Candidatus Alcyoniella australis]